MEFFRHRQPKPVRDDAGPVAGPPDHRDAFAEGIRRGRKEERVRHKGHPFLALLVVLVAVVGVAFVVLAAKEGSFSRGGALVDQNLSAAADQAKGAGAGAVAKTGEAIKEAGASIERKASDTAGENK